MDCAYKNDGGGNVGFNVVDKGLDPINFSLGKTSTQVSTKSSNSGQLQGVVTNGNTHFFQVECNGNESINSGFSLDKQVVLLNNNIINETNKLDTDIDQKATLDQSLLYESCERTAKRKCFEVEVRHQLNTVQSSQELKDLILEEKSSGVEQRENGVINGELPKEKLSEISQCVDTPSNISHDEIIPFANSGFTNSTKVNTNKQWENAKIKLSPLSEIESNVVEDNQTSDSGVNCQSVYTPFSSSENIDECVSDEEVYLEVDEIDESDQVSDATSEEEYKKQIDQDCAKTVGILIKNIETEETECKLHEEEEAEVPALSLNTLQYPDSQDEAMSEEEVYEEVEEDFDEELDLEKQEVNDNEKSEDEMVVDSECADSSLSPVKSLVSTKKLKDYSVESKLDQDKVLSEDLKSESNSELKDHFNEASSFKEKISEGNDKSIEKTLEDKFTVNEKLPDDSKSESSTELEVNANEKSHFNEKESEGNGQKADEKTLEDEFALDKNLPKDSKSESNKELEEYVNLESHLSEDKDEKTVERTFENEFALCENLLESPERKSGTKLKECTNEVSHLGKEKDDIDENVVKETLESELLIIDEDDDVECDEEQTNVSNEDNEFMTEGNVSMTEGNVSMTEGNVSMTEGNKKEKLLDTSTNTEGKLQGDTPAMDISDEVRESVTSTDQVNISNCIVQKDTEKMNVAKSPKKIPEEDDYDEEFESLIEEFVVTECASEDAKAEAPKSEILLLESEDELEVIMEDFKAANSDDDCLIVEDTNKEVVINVDYESSKRKNLGSGSSPLKIDTKTAPEVTNDSQNKGKTEEFSNIGTNIKLKDTVDNVSNMTMMPVSKQASSVDMEIIDKAKQQECIKSILDKSNTSKLGSKVGPSESSLIENISNVDIKSQSDKVKVDNVLCVTIGSEQNSLIKKSDFSSTGNKLSFNNYGLFSNVGNEKSLLKNSVNAEESIQASVEVALSNLLTEVCPPFSGLTDCNAKSKSVCDTQQKSESVASSSKDASRESDSKSSLMSAQDENSEDENILKTAREEIIIDDFNPLEKATKLNSSVVNSLEKCIIKEDSKKRMFDEIEDDPSLANTKKLKSEEIAIEIPYDSNSKVQRNIQEKALELIPQENSFKFITTKKILDKIVKHVLAKSMEDVEPSSHARARKNADEAEEIFQVLDEDFQLFNVQVTDFVSAQEEKFQQKNFNPQVQTRTVGVNVKIFRECDLQHFSPAPTVLSQNSGQIPRVTENPVTNKVTPLVPVSKPPLTSSVPLRPNIPASSAVSRLLVNSQQLPPIRRPPAPAIVTNASRPRQVVTQRFTSVSPNVTIAGNPLSSVLPNSSAPRPLVSHPSTVPSRFQAPTTNRLIDLTGDGSINRRPATTLAAVPSTSVSNVNIPGLAGNQKVFVPLSNFFQMLPSTQNNSQFSTGTQVQMPTGPHSVLQPSLQPGLGPRTVYIMPSVNSGQLTNYGARTGIPMPPFITGPNQRVQTIVVRVTNPGQSTPLSTLVSSTPRMQAPSNSILNTNTVTTATSSGLVIIPQAANKHPAPFPITPLYPVNSKLKVLPPQPALKGSRAPQQGIILSWNMNLQSSHADISNYQLFAYQETSAMVTSTLWKKVGDVKALPLPMACTLTQFIEGHRYYFTVRAVDIHGRLGKFSDPVTIMYSKQDDSQASSK